MIGAVQVLATTAELVWGVVSLVILPALIAGLVVLAVRTHRKAKARQEVLERLADRVDALLQDAHDASTDQHDEDA